MKLVASHEHNNSAVLHSKPSSLCSLPQFSPLLSISSLFPFLNPNPPPPPPPPPATSSLSLSPSMATRHTCLKLELPVEDPKREGAVGAAIFVKGTWHPSRFSLAVTDGAEAWTCDASDAEVKLRAEQWDLSPQDYLALAERYLAFQQPGSRYAFDAAADPHAPRRLSWTFEKQGTKLEWRWKCQPAPNKKQTTAEILDFLMDANIRLSEEVVRKTQAFDKLKAEAERCLQQSERFSNEKVEFESSVYSKFVAILNSKKAKLRDLRDRISKLEATDKAVEEDDDDDDQSSGKTESFHEASDAENIKEEALQEESDDTTSMKGRKKARR
ncbi:DNA repair protein XRCC4 [Ananas comosus]|uniref:DNA repair protein XRCC4 n=1 Tax=Ananas comosus TaxID=4615 RepID=A0A6P5FH70_ANACO|nr:DNA repair protein XRCC4 [Ananas comosus]